MKPEIQLSLISETTLRCFLQVRVPKICESLVQIVELGNLHFQVASNFFFALHKMCLETPYFFLRNAHN